MSECSGSVCGSAMNGAAAAGAGCSASSSPSFRARSPLPEDGDGDPDSGDSESGLDVGSTPRLSADCGRPSPAAQDSGLGYDAGCSAKGWRSPFRPLSEWLGTCGSGGETVGLPSMIVAPASDPTARATPEVVTARRRGSVSPTKMRSVRASTTSSGTVARSTCFRRGMTYGDALR